ncbi:MAG: site-2 protease family protein [Chloroflexi bacterium]|nr:site-2 protease family protein [Chloroflexota bacterium]MBU1750681.1 site-2 protease family protein [Chloroflexota bacterium]
MLGNGIRIGRVLGIDIRIDWSWLLILLLVVWNLGTAFGESHPDWGLALTWSLAIIAALLFFGSVLAHELAHSVYARSRGVPVRNITLFLFGGVSNIQRDPDSPRDEFIMAFVGPLTSLVLGGLLIVVAGAIAGLQASATADPAQVMARLDPLTTMLLWLGSINVILGIFNLIPGFPLDGGRVLRSILWAVTKNLHRATRWAAWVGQGIAWLMIIGGIAMAFGVDIPFFGTGFLGGLWLVFIGWFLNTASVQSYQQLVVHDLLTGVTVERMMRPNPPTTCPDCTVSSLVHDHVMGTDDHAFPVLDDGRLVGIVTLEDIRKVPRTAWDTTVARAIMTPAERLVTVSPADDAAETLDKLSERDVNQLPVLRGGDLVGLLRRRDVVRWLQFQSQSPR